MTFNLDRLYLVTEIPGYSPQIGHLVSMMNFARATTLESVKDLTREQLDYIYDSDSNSIGALLLHMAAIEFAYQVCTFEEREFSEEELKRWGPALSLGEEGRTHIKGHDLDYYLTVMSEVRERTFELFKTKSDEWLYEERDFWNNRQANFYFMWFHVFEDEINHRGQIRWISKRIRE